MLSRLLSVTGTGTRAYLAIAAVAICISVAIWLSRVFDAPKSLGDFLATNGFVEVRPPSTLLSVGTWVQVLAEKPLRLGIICSPKEALGLNPGSDALVSRSIDLSLTSERTFDFHLEGRTLQTLGIQTDLNAVQAVNFTLSNVTLVELQDTAIVDGVSRRTTSCQKAIKFRLSQDNPVSMIKSTLIGNAEYKIIFKSGVDLSVKSRVAEALATKLGTTTTNTETHEIRRAGTQLVWGVRDDKAAAVAGFGLPATGQTDEANKSILDGKGFIDNVERLARPQSRRPPTGKTVLASVDLTPKVQMSQMGCWAAVYAMMSSWLDQTDWPIRDAVAMLGQGYIRRLEQDTGLPGGSERQFVADAGMIAKPPASYFPWTFVNMLSTYGPLWIIVGDGISSHALVVVGIYGNPTEESYEGYKDVIFEVIDPTDGAYHYLSFLKFQSKFEGEAAFLASLRTNKTPLRWQVLHWPERNSG